ncbi:MAG: GspE/PulE family protein [Phycisphaeraceae bacterium]
MQDAQPAHTAAPPRVGDLLVDRGMITPEQLSSALEYQRNSDGRKLLGGVLVELGFVSQDQVMAAVADSYGLPFARIDASLVDPALCEVLPLEYCEKQGVVPMFLVEGRLTVAVHDPANVFIAEEIGRMSGHTVQLVAATLEDIRAVLATMRQSEADVFVIDEEMDAFDLDNIDLVENQSIDVSAGDGADESPVIKLVNYVMLSAVRESASDIHIEPDDGTLRVRYRVDGRLYEKLTPPYHLLPSLVSRIKIMASLDISERRVPQDGAITIRVDNRQIDLRVSTMPGKFGEKVVMRIVDQKNAVANLDKLGFSEHMLKTLRMLIGQPNGVMLVTGPTGSGKSTTLYGALAEINREDINISTVEDPVEYNLAGINQFQTHDKAGFTFAKALRALLRQDPDVVMLGEIRDQETAKIATQAALTGHLVLSTLHTNDAPSAVTRLINIGVEPYLVAAALRGVLAQRLVRKICSHCAEPAVHDEFDRNIIEHLSREGYEITQTLRGAGCKKCRNSGYSGRMGLYELFVPDAACMDAVSKGASLQEIRMLAGKGSTYITLKEDGITKVMAGMTTLKEVFKVVAV